MCALPYLPIVALAAIALPSLADSLCRMWHAFTNKD